MTWLGSGKRVGSHDMGVSCKNAKFRLFVYFLDGTSGNAVDFQTRAAK